MEASGRGRGRSPRDVVSFAEMCCRLLRCPVCHVKWTRVDVLASVVLLSPCLVLVVQSFAFSFR